MDPTDGFDDLFDDDEDDLVFSPKPSRKKVTGAKTMAVKKPKKVPLKANQVRAYVNKKKETQYYIVVNREINEKKEPVWGALWFRMQEEAPMHLSFGFKVKEEHPVIMENINIVRDTLEKVHHGDD